MNGYAAPLGTRVLAIDDDAGQRSLLSHTLGGVGFHVDMAGTGREGLARIRERCPDLVLCDVAMPGMDGFEVLESLRADPLTLNLPFVLVTARSDRDAVRRGMRLGADDFLSKPVRALELVEAVSAALHKRQRLAAIASPPPCAAAASGELPCIDGYQVLEKIGEGGMSSVYLARRHGDGRAMVVKVLKGRRADDEVLWNRFFQECAILSSVEHPNVVRIYDQGFDDEFAWLAMEHLAAGSLRERIRRRLWPREALTLLGQAAAGLAEVHRRGIVHRDVKPANLMLRDENTLVLTDFGVAKRLARGAEQTLHGEVIGTPFYLAPEQAAGGPVTPRADLYSLGVIFHEMLTGERPFDGETIEEILAGHLSALVPPLPAALGRYQPLIDGLLAKRAEDRFASAEALIDVIEIICSA